MRAWWCFAPDDGEGWREVCCDDLDYEKREGRGGRVQEKEERRAFTREREFVVVSTDTGHEFTVLGCPARISSKALGTEKSKLEQVTKLVKMRLSTERFSKAR